MTPYLVGIHQLKSYEVLPVLSLFITLFITRRHYLVIPFFQCRAFGPGGRDSLLGPPGLEKARGGTVPKPISDILPHITGYRKEACRQSQNVTWRLGRESSIFCRREIGSRSPVRPRTSPDGRLYAASGWSVSTQL